jgi:thiol-disulfide isomerase/thioredoxin
MTTRYLLSLAVGLVLLGGTVRAHGQDAKGGSSAAGPGIGTQAPDFTLKVLDGSGKTMQLSTLKGKAVLVNFWATWCEPCKIEMPWLVELQKKYGPQGLQIVGVTLDDADEKTIADFARKMKINYPVVIGTEKVADLYGGINGMPMTFYLDRSGKVVNRVLGLVSESEIEESIKKSLATDSRAGSQKGDPSGK